MSLSLYDFRDLDLMLKIEELGDNEGWVSTADLTSALGLGDQHASVAIRCSWMRRYGMLDFDDKTRKGWRLSDGGVRVIKAKLKAAVAKQIEAVPDVSLIDVMAHVTTRYRMGDALMATMLRREFLYGTSSRSAVWGK